jgi:hypothetical protein
LTAIRQDGLLITGVTAPAIYSAQGQAEERMDSHTEADIDPNTFASLAGAADEGAKLIGVSPSADPEAIVEAVDAFVFAWQCGTRPSKNAFDPDDVPFAIGSLWGQQIVRKFGWHWKSVTFHEHGNTSAPGVLSPDRALAIYPIHFVLGCLKDSNVDTTIMLSYNMLVAGQMNGASAGAYTNVMEGVHRLIPRIAVQKPWWKRLFG